MSFAGVIIGVGAFIIIGVLHPIVIKAEYYIGSKAWPIFLLTGLLCIGFSLVCEKLVLSALLAVLGFSLLWSIQELFQQVERVERGWFPRNPKKDGFRR
ncbi:MAG: DUF4491 family protein [Propionibacteriaceae bacterium]|nr:DUF4491 family protein [Propionibacteriaceae bacterium]